MSKYMTFTEIAFKDRALLVAALEEIGCIEIQQGNALPLGRYYSEQTPQTADVIIPRNTIGNAYGDIGFQRNEAGALTPNDLGRRAFLTANRLAGIGAIAQTTHATHDDLQRLYVGTIACARRCRMCSPYSQSHRHPD